jgi:hypothetical protein
MNWNLFEFRLVVYYYIPCLFLLRAVYSKEVDLEKLDYLHSVRREYQSRMDLVEDRTLNRVLHSVYIVKYMGYVANK